MWWIALYLPQWPLEALGAPAPDAVEENGCIVCLNAASAEAGVRTGMSVPAAEARLPGLKVRARQADREAQALRALALTALRFSPHLCLRPDGFLIEVQASLRLFGGPVPLWQQLHRAVQSFKVSAHLAAAPFPEAAWLLARVRGPWREQAQRLRQVAGPMMGVAQSRQAKAVRLVLDALPLPLVMQAWGAPPAAQQLLNGLGVATLGECQALPRAGLQRRLGAHWVNCLDRAYGQAPDPRPFWAPPLAFDERLELPERSTDAELIAQALQHLLQALEGWLVAQGRLAQVLALHLLHEARRGESMPDTVHPLRLAAPERQAAALQRLWAERLGRHPLASPVVALRLVLQASEAPQTQELQKALEVACVRQPGTQDPADTRQALARLLDRLQARLGHQAVQGLYCEDDHRPERASRIVALTDDEARRFIQHRPPSEFPGSGMTPGPMPMPMPMPMPTPELEPPQHAQGQPQQPLWLLPTPEPLAERQGQPLHRGMPLMLRTRPERIEAGWFDADPVCRDYQVAEASDHRLCWVFRERRGAEQGWYLHGWFN